MDVGGGGEQVVLENRIVFLAEGAESEGDWAIAQFDVARLAHDAVGAGMVKSGRRLWFSSNPSGHSESGWCDISARRSVSSLQSCSISLLASRCWKVRPMAVLARLMAMVWRVPASSSGCPCMTLREL